MTESPPQPGDTETPNDTTKTKGAESALEPGNSLMDEASPARASSGSPRNSSSQQQKSGQINDESEGDDHEGSDDGDEAEGNESDEEEEDEEEDEEPKLKYARLTQHLNPVYRNGDATSSFLVAGDKMVWLPLHGSSFAYLHPLLTCFTDRWYSQWQYREFHS